MVGDLRSEHVGRRVLFHPNMAEVAEAHPGLARDLARGLRPAGGATLRGQEVEVGRVSSWNSLYVFVRFGDEESSAKACRRDQLAWADAG